MLRSLRIRYPRAYYDVMARGNRRETIFHDDDDRRFFLHTLGQHEQRHPCEPAGPSSGESWGERAPARVLENLDHV